MEPAGHIISVSRRTDVPAHYAEWFLARVRQGFCEYVHPFSRKRFRVSLRPADVLGIVFWSRDYRPMLPHLAALLEQYVFYSHLTLTGHGPALEPNAMPLETAIAAARDVARLIGPEKLVWRFDPVVFTQSGSADDTLARMRHLAHELEGATRHCVISHMSPYRRQARAFAERGLTWDEPSPELRREVAARLAEVASQHGMTLSVCCNADVVGPGVSAASCVSAHRLRSLGALIPEGWPRGPSRASCGCDRSVDIGAYDTCPSGCAYCYANQDHARAAAYHRAHDASWPSLVPPAEGT